MFFEFISENKKPAEIFLSSGEGRRGSAMEG
jgi:hypothetical protein